MIQCGAALVIAILAGLPTAEALTCPLRAAAAPAVCATGMTATSSDCPMAREAAANNCLRDCCNCGLPKLVGPLAVRLHLKQGMLVQFVALATLTADADRVVATAPQGPVPSSSPPRYILHRVFRI